MPALNNIRVETVCEKNRHLLEDFEPQELINGEGFIDLNSLGLEQQKQIIKEIINNEESNAIASKENYQKLKYKAKNTSELLVLALALIVAGLTLAPLFIASSIILPVLPVLFFGIAIIAITNLFLNRKINKLETKAEDADKVFKQVKVLNQLTDLTKDREIREIKSEIKSASIAISSKIDMLAANNPSSSELLVNQGTFRVVHEDPVNELHNRESIVNITHS